MSKTKSEMQNLSEIQLVANLNYFKIQNAEFDFRYIIELDMILDSTVELVVNSLKNTI